MLAEKQQRLGKILKDVSEEDAGLLVRTLVVSVRARIEGGVLTINPGGILIDHIRRVFVCC